MKPLIILLLIFTSNMCYAKLEQLHLSNKVVVDISIPEKLSHSDNMLILKYYDWYFSHEIINPKEFYTTIDLTDIQHEFLKSVFYPNLRTSLPNWLGELANEQAMSFGLSKTNVINRKFGDVEVLGGYDDASKQGNILVFEKYQIHHLSIGGEDEYYIELLNAIKRK